MLLAEIEIRHSRAIAPTRRVALGPYWLPTEPSPGYGGILLMHQRRASINSLPGWLDQLQQTVAEEQHRYQSMRLEVAELEAPNRIVASGAKNERIRIRHVDKSRFDEEAALILGILNDAWSDNWGFIPLTDSEIAYAGKKLKPIVYEDLIRIAELDGEPVAFMITLPDMNEFIRDLDGRL